MKKWTSLCLCLLAVFCLLLITPKASAATSGIYIYEVTNGEATITYCDESVSGDITIPDTLGGYPVTTIGDLAFYECSSLTSITIGSSVTTIGDNAFTRCSSLTSITIGSSVTTIGGGAFYECSRLTSITIGSSVTTIGDWAFYDCYSLTSITIPDGATTIGDSAFSCCSSLTSITIPDSVTTIGYSAFYDCRSLTSITIPDGVTTIDGSAFSYCSKLTSITIPDGVTTIGEYAFLGCSRLTSITIPDSVTTIEKGAFTGCTSLKTVYYTGTEAQWNKISIASDNKPLANATIVHKHTFTDYVFNNNATCTQDGTETRTCTACGEQETRPVTGTATGHRFTDYISNNDATCIGNGTKTATCERCAQTDTVEDPDAVGEHVWNEGDYYPPTQKREGYTLFTCTLCGETKKVEDLPPAEIIAQPVSVAVDSGETVQFTVQTGGVVTSYKWEYRKLYKWFDTTMEGFNTDTLTVPATGARNGYDYRCVITFADGTVLISDAAELTVRTYLTITSNPNDQTVVLGYKGQFTVAATGEGLKYRWEYRRPDGERWIETAMEGNTKPTVMIETTTARDGYEYRCKITDVTGNVAYSDTATMRVLGFTSHPVEVFTRPDKTVTFTVTTTVTEGFTYQWQYRRSASANWTNTTMSGYDTACLTVDPSGKNGYEYRCIVIGSKDSKLESKSAVLHVGGALVIEDQSVDCTVQAGKNVFLMVEATNVYTYQWQYARAGSSKWSNTTMEGATTEVLKVQATTARNGYQYRCVIKGLDGTETISEIITLTVR